jgi:phosphatidylglycerol lysyltransferase
VALWVIYRTLREIRLVDVWEQVISLPFSSVILGILITATAYCIVTVYDVLALKHIDRHIPFPRVALAGFLACAFSTNLGFAIVTGGAIRYRIYSMSGLSALEIAGITTMCALTASLGLGFIMMLSMLFGSDQIADSALHMPESLRHTLGGLMLACMALYIAFAAYKPVNLRIMGWSVPLPSARTAAAQIALGTVDLMLIGTLIYVLLPDGPGVGFLTFVGVFCLAFIAGVLSHVPGGIGVFESVMLVGLPTVSPTILLGALVLFRCFYYLLPLSLAAIVLAIHEIGMHKTRITTARNTVGDWLAELGPQVMAIMIIFAGVILLFTGAIPSPTARLATLRETVPLAIVEFAHIATGIAGLGVVILARGLSLRLQPAYRLTVLLLSLGIFTLLLRGLIYEGSLVVAAILAVLVATRQEFRREGSLFNQGYPAEWVSTLTSILAVTIWIGLMSYRHYDYSPGLWWQFDYAADFARFLRTSAVILMALLGVTLVNLLRPDPIPDRPSGATLDQVRRIVRQDENTRSSLALLGDKRFLFSNAGNAFIMYRVRGKSWIALGDPVGPASEYERLVWTFSELCDRYGGRPAFYLVDGDHLPLYVDLGLSVLKLGDDARVALDRFSLQGNEHAELRRTHNRILEQGISFSIVNSAKVPPLLHELRRVSDSWLTEQKRAEKSFARGGFDPDYVSNFPCAIARQDKRIIAFGVLWASANNEELALDLMRYHREAPEGIMKFITAELMIGGRRRGFRWFNLGMVPTTGMERHALAPLWQRIGGILYRQSEHFKDTESLRQFAEELGPIWRPKYLASPGGIKTARVLRDIASLIAKTGR